MSWLKKLFRKKEKCVEPVKEELEPVVAEEVPAPKTEIVREKQFVVNCPRCGAAVKVSGTAPAYLCGACRQLFRVRIEAKMVKDLTAEDLSDMEAPIPEEVPVVADDAAIPEECTEIVEEVEEIVEEIAETSDEAAE